MKAPRFLGRPSGRPARPARPARPLAALLGGALLALLCVGARAVAAEGDPSGVVLRARAVYALLPSAPQQRIDGGAVVVVRDGKIAAVGRAGEVEIPEDLPLVDLGDAVLAPGFVAAASDIVDPHRGVESQGAAYSAIDAFDPYGDYTRWLRAGVTTVHVSAGGGRLVNGQGAVVKLAGAPARRRLRAEADLEIQLGDAADNPPAVEVYSFPASSDVAITPPRAQRPRSRLGRVLALREWIDAVEDGGATGPDGNQETDLHVEAFARVWRAARPLRVRADRAVDILAALRFLDEQGRSGYLVGGTEAHRVAAALRSSGAGLVLRPFEGLRSPGRDLGAEPAVDPAGYGDLTALDGVPLALAPPLDASLEELRLAAVLARGAGLDPGRALAAITRTAAEILGVGDRVGSLAPGRDADIVVLSGDPLDLGSHVLRVYVDGALVHDATRADTIVVRAGTIWLGPGEEVRDGAMLIEAGKIAAVGKSVPHPPAARVLDLGAEGFVTPGFIDCHGHLGLEGDRGAAAADVDLTRALGVPGPAERRVARSGITTVLLTSYSIAGNGSRVTAIKPVGETREERVARPVAAVAFSVAGSADPLSVREGLERILGRADAYLKKWRDYEKARAEYEKKAAGEATSGADAPAEKEGADAPAEGEPGGGDERAGTLLTVAEEGEEGEEATADPVTGVWQLTETAGDGDGDEDSPPRTGTVTLARIGDRVEGRILQPPTPLEHRIVLALDGKELEGVLEIDTEGSGYPTITATLTEEDKAEGSITFLTRTVAFSAQRTERIAVEFRVDPPRESAEGPQPPPVDPALEPLKDLLEGTVPALVEVSDAVHIREVVKLFRDERKLALILLGAEGSHLFADLLAEKDVAVVLPRDGVYRRDRRERHLADTLARAGVRFGFQSAAEDGARALGLNALFAVERGLAPDVALAALTTYPARFFKIDDRLGTLAPGRDADFLVFRGHPFRSAGRVERVFVDGQEVKP